MTENRDRPEMACPYFLLLRHYFNDSDVILSGELDGLPCNMSEFLFCTEVRKIKHIQNFFRKNYVFSRHEIGNFVVTSVGNSISMHKHVLIVDDQPFE